jgi:hypothetical protein
MSNGEVGFENTNKSYGKFKQVVKGFIRAKTKNHPSRDILICSFAILHI